jgi:hypothetical protein
MVRAIAKRVGYWVLYMAAVIFWCMVIEKLLHGRWLMP